MCANQNPDKAKHCVECGALLDLITGPKSDERAILWKCKARDDGTFDVDWSGSPTFWVTLSAVGQDYSTLHLVPAVRGVGMAIPEGRWLLERAPSSGPLNVYLISPSEIVLRFRVVSSKLADDYVMIVQVK